MSGNGGNYVPAPLAAPETITRVPGMEDSNNNIPKDSECHWALTLFSITTVLLFADQNLMALNLTAIAQVHPHTCLFAWHVA
jgi:hypothetical protein